MEVKTVNLQQVAMTDFVLLRAEGSADEGRGLVQSLHPAYVIVQRTEQDNEYFYLFSSAEALALLRNAPQATSIRHALDLQESGATPALESTTVVIGAGESIPDRCIVLDNGRPIGYFDATSPPTHSTRGGGAGTTTRAEAKAPTHSLRAEMPQQVELNTTVSLLISVPSVEPRPGDLPISQPVGTTLDVVLSVRRGFTLEGSNEGTLTIGDNDEAPPLRFKLRASEVGPADVRVLAFHDGIALGTMKLMPKVTPAGSEAVGTATNTSEAALAPVMVQVPDLVLFVEEAFVNNRLEFTFRLTAQDPTLDLTARKYGPVVLTTDPGQYFEEFYKDIDNLQLNTVGQRAIAAQQLADKGIYLFNNVFPPEVQEVLKSNRERIKTVWVQSEEPWVPWEICRFPDDPDEAGTEGKFFCEAFAMTRWLLGDTSAQPYFKLKNIAVVVPVNSGLPLAAAEQDYLLSLVSADRQVAPVAAQFIALSKELKSNLYDTWHFTGHGAARAADPDRAVIELEDAPFTPLNLSSVAAYVKRNRPFVFLNACQAGQSGLSLTGIGGWARQFLQAGASAFVGAYWSVYDQAAFDFAKELYSRLLAGESLGEAARGARLAIKSEVNPTTWLAYTVFGNPFAKVQQ
jgi:hypothetical protein